MTLTSALAIIVAGALCAVLLDLVTRNSTVTAAGRPLVFAWVAVGLLMVCVAFYFAGRLLGVPEYRGEETPVIVNGFFHWVLFAATLGAVLWAAHKVRRS